MDTPLTGIGGRVPVAQDASYFGEMFQLMRDNLSAGGSELGLGLTLFSLAVSIQARNIIEIGRFKGFSTLALGSALRFLDTGWREPEQHKQRPDINYAELEQAQPRRLLSIDPTPTPEAAALVERAGIARYVAFVDAPSEAVEIDGQADLVFIDGDHTYEGCAADVRRLVPQHVRPGGYFVLHDYFGWYDQAGVNRSPVKDVIHEIIVAGGHQHLMLDTHYMSFVVFRRPDPRIGI